MNNLTRLFLPTCIILLAGLTACAPTTITLSPETPSVEITTPSQTPRLATATEPPTATAKPTETLIPTPTESVSPEFWEALKAKMTGGWKGEDWSPIKATDNSYLIWHKGLNAWLFRYAVDGTAVHNVPIPGLDGVVADLAVRAYYYDANGDRQTILVAMIIRLPDGSLIYTGDLGKIRSQAEIDQEMKDYPGAYQTGIPGALPGAQIMPVENYFIGGQTPGSRAYLQFVEANQAALDEFIKTGSPTLKIILPAGLSSSGGNNILNDDNLQPPTPTP